MTTDITPNLEYTLEQSLLQQLKNYEELFALASDMDLRNDNIYFTYISLRSSLENAKSYNSISRPFYSACLKELSRLKRRLPKDLLPKYPFQQDRHGNVRPVRGR